MQDNASHPQSATPQITSITFYLFFPIVTFWCKYLANAILGFDPSGFVQTSSIYQIILPCQLVWHLIYEIISISLMWADLSFLELADNLGICKWWKHNLTVPGFSADCMGTINCLINSPLARGSTTFDQQLYHLGYFIIVSSPQK